MNNTDVFNILEELVHDYRKEYNHLKEVVRLQQYIVNKMFFDDEYVLDTSTWSWHARRLPRISRFPISLCNLAHLYDDTGSSEFDGCVFRAAVKVPRSLLPHNIRDSSLDSEETAPSPDISDAVLFYGGLATNESKSKTFTFQFLDPVVLNTM